MNPKTSEDFSKSSKAYLFTTEPLASYMPHLSLEGKKTACITGSGDFAFNAFLQGAKSVDLIDIAPAASFMAELKAAGLSHFSYEEFLTFFAGSPPFCPKLYEKLHPHLSEEAKELFARFPEAIIDKIGDKSFIEEANLYLSDEASYRMAQKALRPLSLYTEEAKSYFQETAQRYDFIHLSNIFSYSDKRPDEIIEAAFAALEEKGIVSSFFFISLQSPDHHFQALVSRMKKRGVLTRQIIGGVPYTSNSCFIVLLLQKLFLT